jgi:hypothetical protein
MEKWLVLVETNCRDEARDAEFNRWYDTVHVPDALSSPDHKSATRYVIKDRVKGKGKYLAIYEIETDDIKRTMELSAKNIESKKAAGRWSDLLEVVSMRLCKVEN